MRDLPVNLGAYVMRVAEEPAVKADRDGQVMTKYDSEEPLYVVSLYTKSQVVNPATGKRPKGEEIKVTLLNEPPEGIEEGDLVELINPTASPWGMKGRKGTDEVNSGFSFRADNLKPVG